MLMSLFSPIFRLFAIIKSFLVYEVRIDGLVLSNFYDAVDKRGKTYTTSCEFKEKGIPRQYDAYCYYKRLLFIFDIKERILKTGDKSIEIVSSITIFRLQKKRLLSLLEDCNKNMEEEIPIVIPDYYQSIKIGSLKVRNNLDSRYINNALCDVVDKEIRSVLDKEQAKVGFLLHGLPGNGKSCIIKYFAIKFKLPINIILLSRDDNNTDIIKSFSNIPERSIILFEDFDSYFKLRENKMKGAQFTLDTILNVIDGSYTDNEGKIFFMTTNSIEDIDPALKCRPSRFKHVFNIDYPSQEIKQIIFEDYDDEVIAKSNKLTLDQCLFFRERLDAGDDVESAYSYIHQSEEPVGIVNATAASNDNEGITKRLL